MLPKPNRVRLASITVLHHLGWPLPWTLSSPPPEKMFLQVREIICWGVFFDNDGWNMIQWHAYAVHEQFHNQVHPKHIQCATSAHFVYLQLQCIYSFL